MTLGASGQKPVLFGRFVETDNVATFVGNEVGYLVSHSRMIADYVSRFTPSSDVGSRSEHKRRIDCHDCRFAADILRVF